MGVGGGCSGAVSQCLRFCYFCIFNLAFKKKKFTNITAVKNFVFKIQGGNHAEKGMENSFIFIKVYHIYDKIIYLQLNFLSLPQKWIEIFLNFLF